MPPGLYPLENRAQPVFVATDPQFVIQFLGGSNGAFTKSPLPLTIRQVLGDGTATSGFPPESKTDDTPYSDLNNLRYQKQRATFMSLKATQAACAGTINWTTVAPSAVAHTVRAHNINGLVLMIGFIIPPENY